MPSRSSRSPAKFASSRVVTAPANHSSAELSNSLVATASRCLVLGRLLASHFEEGNDGYVSVSALRSAHGRSLTLRIRNESHRVMKNDLETFFKLQSRYRSGNGLTRAAIRLVELPSLQTHTLNQNLKGAILRFLRDTEQEHEAEIAFSRTRRRAQARQAEMANIQRWLSEGAMDEEVTGLIRCAAYWLTHPSGPVAAPGDSRNIRSSKGRFTLTYGANTLDLTQVFTQAGMVLDKSLRYEELISLYDEIDDSPPTKKSILAQLASVPSGCIYDYNGKNYDDYGSKIKGWIVFGSHALKLSAVSTFLFRKSKFKLEWL